MQIKNVALATSWIIIIFFSIIYLKYFYFKHFIYLNL